ncbi:hypothetical protein [Bacillus sp. FJAT-28004]|uniref:hypothetical protein n=1 Tax=Bacillus sp. FJAT-28004 TaxID=1679165 RepID=UPI0006B5A53E|nr:hypothetical protein [Bacillus sp. FJAT-28004]
MELYFKDNFFSAGETLIMDAVGDSVGTLNLQSMFSATLSVYASDNALLYNGKFRFFSSKWEVRDAADSIIGVLRSRFTFFSKSYEYDAGERGIFQIESPAFSYVYSIIDMSGQEVASFEKTSNWLQSGAFRLHNLSTELDSYELIAVVMGVHSIQKAATNTAAT